ncbi:phytoene dehydrogenase [Lewinellaceae bacterium SD302]|nr:phytoene dehydrogenase [Lewinellaceae bacterium SD302]
MGKDSQSKKAIIVGAGIAGLAAAVRLAVAGYRVEVYDQNEAPGGKLSQFSLGDYRFDFGPSLFTMPQYVDELFVLAGEDPRDHFNYQQLPIVCHYWWEDGTTLDAPAEIAQLADNCAAAFGVDRQKIIDFMAQAAKKYDSSGRIFLEKSLHKADTWLSWEVAKTMLKIPGLDLFKSMHAVHERDLGHPKLVQLFDRYATYNGSNPYKAPGLLSMIPHFEHHFGAYLPEGGMYDISRSVYELAKRLGVQFFLANKVAEITLEGERATGIRTSTGHHSSADLVVCNMDVFLAYDKLLPTARKPERTLRQQKSTSAVIFYWGIRADFAELGVHNILFSDDYQQEFNLMEAGDLSDDPTVYINVSSKLVKEDAPAGKENWFVMVNAPADAGQDWDTLKAQLRQQVIDKIDRILLKDRPESVADLIEEERILGPSDLEILTGSHQGALYGTSSNNPFSAFLRHPNFSKRINDLYFLGGSVHPGGGVPLCLLSARIVGDLIQKQQ